MAPAEIQRESHRGRNRVLPFASRHWLVARALREMVFRLQRADQRRDARVRYEQDATRSRPAADVA